MSTASSPTPARPAHPIALKRILCGVSGSRTDEETVRQACTIADDGACLDIACVDYGMGTGATGMATISVQRAERALRAAAGVAAEAGVTATTALVEDSSRWGGLASRLPGHDLLVVGGHTRSRAEGIIGGSLGTEALHRSPIPVLLARAVGTPFPSRVLLATDGSPDSALAAEYAAAIAARHDAAVTVLTIGSPEDRAKRRELAAQTAGIFIACGAEPVIDIRDGSPRTAIVDAARRHRPSLVVLGSGGKTGIHAIGSVSEHVAHHVACSVLVARHARAVRS